MNLFQTGSDLRTFSHLHVLFTEEKHGICLIEVMLISGMSILQQIRHHNLRIFPPQAHSASLPSRVGPSTAWRFKSGILAASGLDSSRCMLIGRRETKRKPERSLTGNRFSAADAARVSHPGILAAKHTHTHNVCEVL